ncbi:hypothetical protein D9613_012213 [Agrocybe pediades]|uniref:Uncharacterized protein n=1 Tax=Agrocybe pediades TaxID=84607 RepID=A0A8H4R440_9AGAR|nr:hypothetical protein D9613_012213 [Agrocybe pediades]
MSCWNLHFVVVEDELGSGNESIRARILQIWKFNQTRLRVGSLLRHHSLPPPTTTCHHLPPPPPLLPPSSPPPPPPPPPTPLPSSPPSRHNHLHPQTSPPSIASDARGASVGSVTAYTNANDDTSPEDNHDDHHPQPPRTPSSATAPPYPRHLTTLRDPPHFAITSRQRHDIHRTTTPNGAPQARSQNRGKRRTTTA